MPLRIFACSVVAGYGRDLTENLRVVGFNFTLRFGKVGLCIHVPLRISATYDVVQICLEARLQNAPLEGVTFIGVL